MILTGAAALATAWNASPAFAVPSFHSSVDPTTVVDSLAYLTTTYNISDAEALRRLELQNDAQKLDALLTKDHPDAYGGMWIDQDNGGVLVLSMTDPAVADPYVRSMPDRAHVSTRTVAHSLAELNAVKARVGKAVGEGSDATYLPAVDKQANSVVLWNRDWVAQKKLAGTWEADSLGKQPAEPASAADRQNKVKAEAAVAARAMSAEHGLVTESILKQPTPYYTPYVDWGFCHPLYCSPTYGGMRGGLRLDVHRDDNSWGGCTAGFNVRSGGTVWNGWAWVLTAGHCVTNKTNETPIQHNGWPILNMHGVDRNAYPYDYAILNYTGSYADSWLTPFSHNKVLKYCRNGGQDSDSNTPCGTQATAVDEYITGVHSLGEINAGWIACASGTGTNTANYPDSYDSGAGSGYLVGTRCGVVLSTDVGINTDICARDGDSGGPLFSELDHTAYGILEGSQQSRTGACYSGEKNNYSPISSIMTDVNYGYYDLSDNYGTTFHVITASNG